MRDITTRHVLCYHDALYVVLPMHLMHAVSDTPHSPRRAATRAAAGLLTELREIDIGGLRNLSAASLGVSPAALELAARSAPTRLPPRPLPPPSEPVSMTRARALPQPLGRRDTLPLVGARPDLALQAAAPRDGDAR